MNTSMNKIIWTEKYSVGVKELDAQHQKIIALINRLVDYMEEGKDENSISYVVNEMHTYIIEHFSTEERLLARIKYPALKEQKESHNQFIKNFSNLCIGVGGDKIKAAQCITDVLIEWWDQHILQDDMQYKRYF